jgi:cytochrome c biogenesis protein CcmG, thiol:disulfide interchange protein DsbE
MLHSRTFMTRLRLTLITLLLATAACSGGADAPAPSEEATRPLGATIGYQAPDFTLPRLVGDGELSLSELRGKVVLISFWASWCGPCRAEVPALEEAWQRYQDKDVVLLGVSVDDALADATGFLRTYPVTFPTVFDAAGDRVGSTWEVWSLPTTVLVDRNGVVRRRHVGFTPRQLRDTLAEVDELLQE